MLRLKSCPRCNGDVLLDRDQYGWYEQCLQCGYLSDMQNVIEVQQQPPQEEKKQELSRPHKPGDG